ncbi:hypothetical protein N7539_007800 [Penicillium diatomitis]|uniref:Uncharacterized protein n=1 Tax=Penicillium diatomitis TaxID=2819901 RepID=A0A9X0BNL8_9EURO|nr:uncharacterized protein N7539_007800 [Penicillium diatomitis]KAJ5475513.1 hypothetical protein N7539_007800 [Penicillium diatomitis]
MVQQWLEDLPEDNQFELDTAMSPGFRGCASPEFEAARCVLLEPSENDAAIRIPTVNGKQQAKGDSRPQADCPKSTNPYERKPRRKTREDKYVYKQTSTMDRPCQGKSDKVKRTRVSRKHTINDTFHAFNVPRQRLTLRDVQNVGIFGKGKASPPVNLQAAQDVSFSKRKFLGSPCPAIREAEPIHIRDEKFTDAMLIPAKSHAKRPRPTPFECDFREPVGSFESQEAIESRAHPPSLPSDQKFRGPSRQSQEKDGLFNAGDLAVARAFPKDLNQQSPLPATSRSPTPSSWSITNERLSRESEAVCDDLLEILHAGLCSANEPPIRDSSGRGEVDLEHLKSLLQERKVYWDSKHPTTACTSGNAMIMRSEGLYSDALNHHADIESASPIEGLFPSSRERVYRGYPSDQLQTGQYLSPRVAPRHTQAWYQHKKPPSSLIIDDNLFIESLEAAYRSIVGEENEQLNNSARETPCPSKLMDISVLETGGPSYNTSQQKTISPSYTHNVIRPRKISLKRPSRSMINAYEVFPPSHATEVHEFEPPTTPHRRVSGALNIPMFDSSLKRYEVSAAGNIQANPHVPIPPDFWQKRRLI